MKNPILSLPIIAIIFFSCAPSKTELEVREKAKIDSVIKITQDKMIKLQATEDSLEAAVAKPK